jgi:hypothetical protein
LVVNPKVPCPFCGGQNDSRRQCQRCGKTGMAPALLNGLWSPAAAFLVCGGPSLNQVPFQKLRERGIASLAVNNVAGHVPVAAWCFGDSVTKFHHGLFLDPKNLAFVPMGKLTHPIQVKCPDGTFRASTIQARHCPGVLGFSRTSLFYPETFFDTTYAHWGRGGKQPEAQRPFLCLATILLGIRLLHYLGCPRIYMLGVDFYMDEQAQYAFAQRKRPRNGRYANENAMLREMAPHASQRGLHIFNCNASSRCDVFPHVPFEEALEDCRGGVPSEPFDLAGWYDMKETEQQRQSHPVLDGVAQPTALP